MRADAARLLLPHVKDTAWFFDTELLVLAERAGMRIAEVPVDWVDDPDSRVDIAATALADLRGIARLGAALVRGDLPVHELRHLNRRADPPGVPSQLTAQALRFAGIGVLSTLAYLLLFLAVRPSLGAQAANLIALLITAIGNTAANRRITFGVRGAGHARHHSQGLAVFAVGLALTSGALWLLAAVTTTAPRAVEIGVLVLANLLATALRFVLLREWVFARKGAS
jgi:putative flippase GtrA